MDPLAAATPSMNPYVGMNNNPVSVVDPLGLQGGVNAAVKPSDNTVSPALYAALGITELFNSNKRQNLIGNVDPNAPGGMAAWFADLNNSMHNDQLGATQAQGQTGIGAGMTRKEIEALGYVVDGDLGTVFKVHKWDSNLNRTDGTIAKSNGSILWQGVGGNVGGSNPLSNSSNNYFYGSAMPGLVGSFVTGTQYGRWASMGGANFSGAAYSVQKNLIQDLAMTTKYVNAGTKAIGIAGAALTVGSDAVGVYNYYRYGTNSANAVSPFHAGVDAAASYIGVYGGWIGAAASTGYFLAAPVIWFTPGPTFPTTVPTVDATYVTPR